MWTCICFHWCGPVCPLFPLVWTCVSIVSTGVDCVSTVSNGVDLCVQCFDWCEPVYILLLIISIVMGINPHCFHWCGPVYPLLPLVWTCISVCLLFPLMWTCIPTIYRCTGVHHSTAVFLYIFFKLCKFSFLKWECSCVRVPLCVCVCMCALWIFSMEKILCFTNTLIIITIYILYPLLWTCVLIVFIGVGLHRHLCIGVDLCIHGHGHIYPLFPLV